MCTSVSFRGEGFCFGRNMDIEYGFGQEVIITPRDFGFRFRRAGELSHHYGFVGIGTVRGGYPLYADGMNERGLCMAGLSLPESVYSDRAEGKREVAPFELIPWVLGKCSNLGDARALLKETEVVGISFSGELPYTPLHWHIADSSGALVVECTRSGMRIYEDHIGVLTNSPALPFHHLNLRQYLNLSPAQPEPLRLDGMKLTPFGRGFGALGLPGDFSPASRFVRAVFLLKCSPDEREEERRTSQMFHILDNMAMPRGSVITEDGRQEITEYSCCMYPHHESLPVRGIYYFKSYYNNRLSAVRLTDKLLEGKALTRYSIPKKQQTELLN